MTTLNLPTHYTNEQKHEQHALNFIAGKAYEDYREFRKTMRHLRSHRETRVMDAPYVDDGIACIVSHQWCIVGLFSEDCMPYAVTHFSEDGKQMLFSKDWTDESLRIPCMTEVKSLDVLAIICDKKANDPAETIYEVWTSKAIEQARIIVRKYNDALSTLTNNFIAWQE